MADEEKGAVESGESGKEKEMKQGGNKSGASGKPAQAGEMSVVDHLEELRRRIIICIAAWVVFSIAGWYLTPWIVSYIKAYPQLAGVQLIMIKPAEAFMARFRLAIVSGVVLAVPIIIQQIMGFILPALYEGEKKWAIRLVPASVFLFYLGAAFALFAVIPLTLQFFLVSMTQGIATPQLSVEEYINFLISMTILIGLVFQVPIVILFLTMVGILSSKMLQAGRRYAIVAIFVIAAVATPSTDMLTMVVVAVPMVLLYEVSIWFAKLAGK
ncbi:MAG: twin-arginine translocase subunit TatC [Firmicutes bacterium]|nr:twin-arginine translocase subunit TatC [Bacillota bacterium]